MRLDLAEALGRRRFALIAAAAVSGGGLLQPLPSTAAYGDGANQAVPALVPSPIMPTGEMAKTCKVVALGREDVCLERKLVLTAYDNQQVEKAKGILSQGSGTMVDAARTVLEATEVGDLKSCTKTLKSSFGKEALEALGLDFENFKLLKADVYAASQACKNKDDPSPAARAAIKLSFDVVALSR